MQRVGLPGHQAAVQSDSCSLGDSWFSSPIHRDLPRPGNVCCSSPRPGLDGHLPVLMTDVLRWSGCQAGMVLSSAFCLRGLRHPAALPDCRKGDCPGTDGQMVCSRMSQSWVESTVALCSPLKFSSVSGTGDRDEAES